MSSFTQLLSQLLNTLSPTSAPPSPTPPSASWIWRQNPEAMFTPAQNFARNQQWALPAPYQTQLSPAEEQQFQQWLSQQHNLENTAQYSGPQSVYDMRGFWKAMQSGNPLARNAIDPNDQRIHYPDIWKTPYAATFSNESMYSMPTAPFWKQDQYTLPSGVIYDDRLGKWYGAPSK